MGAYELTIQGKLNGDLCRGERPVIGPYDENVATTRKEANAIICRIVGNWVNSRGAGTCTIEVTGTGFRTELRCQCGGIHDVTYRFREVSEDFDDGYTMFESYDIKPAIDTGEQSLTFESVSEAETHIDSEDHNTIFWSLYGRDAQGVAHCIGDYADFRAASTIYKQITGHEAGTNPKGKAKCGLPARVYGV